MLSGLCAAATLVADTLAANTPYDFWCIVVLWSTRADGERQFVQDLESTVPAAAAKLGKSPQKKPEPKALPPSH